MLYLLLTFNNNIINVKVLLDIEKIVGVRVQKALLKYRVV